MTDGLATCATYEEDEDVELTVDQCLRVLAFNDLNAEQGITSKTLDTLTEEEYQYWLRNYTHNQGYCWLKYSEAYDYSSVSEWGNDPFIDGDANYSFLMPNSRKYEHFYNDPDCNQIFRMGRGREQPDAITFEDVGPWDKNTLLITNRFNVTPWVSHDQMVIQMFGETEQCVAVRVDEIDMGRGLVDGTFRIEYKNATGTVAVKGSDFGLTTDLSSPVTSYDGVDSGLLETNVAICRTPHYLAVCADGPDGDDSFTGGACPTYCEYFPDFKQSDADAPIDMYGNYTVPCGKYDVGTFNGTNSQDDPATTSETEEQRVQALVFADRCDSDNFVMLGGQIINVQGDLSGPLEVECIDSCAAYEDGDTVFEFYNDPEDPWHADSVTKMMLAGITAPAEHADQWRFFVYMKNNNWNICYKGCEDSTEPLTCLGDDDPDQATETDDTMDADGNPLYGEQIYYDVEGTTIILAGNDDYLNTGLGDDTVTGAADNFEIIEDAGGKDTISAGTYDDLIISRSGGEIITGNGDGMTTVQTVRVYPTHEKDHFFGWKDPDDTLQCTLMIDTQQYTNFQLVLDDPWYPDY